MKLIKKLSISRWGRLVLAAAFTGAIFLVIFSTNTVSFLNNDDANIMHTLAGDFTGTPYVSHPFINVLLGLAVSTLYSLYPEMSCWFLVELFALYVGSVALTAGVIKGFTKRRLPLWLPFAASACLIFFFYGYALIQTAFTLTAAVLGAGALALILTFGMDSRDISRPFWALVVILFLCAATFLFRNSSGLSLLPYWGLGFLYRIITVASDVSPQRLSRARRLLLTGAVGSALLCALLIFVNGWGLERLNGKDYVTFEAARGRFMDYPHDTYAENPEIYKAVGWDQTLSEAVECRFYMDERVTADAMNYIVDHSGFYQLPFGVRVGKALRLGSDTARGNGQMLYMLVPLLMILFLATLAFIRRKKGNLVHYIACICFAGGGLLICLYLCYTGRFLLRTFMLAAYPTCVGMLFTLLSLIEPRCALSASISRRARVLNLAVTVLIFLLTIGTAVNTVHALKSVDVRQQIRLTRSLYRYVSEHPSNVYVRTSTTGYDVDPFSAYAHKPVNLFDWGGTSIHTGYLKRQLALNDLDDFTPSIFRRSDVYFASSVDTHQARHFEKYVIQTLGAKGLVEVDRVANYIIIYKVDFGQ